MGFPNMAKLHSGISMIRTVAFHLWDSFLLDFIFVSKFPLNSQTMLSQKWFSLKFLNHVVPKMVFLKMVKIVSELPQIKFGTAQVWD